MPIQKTKKLYLGRQAESENMNREIFDIFHAKLNNIIFLLLYIIIVLYRYSLFLNVISRMNPILINIFLEFYEIYLRESSIVPLAISRFIELVKHVSLSRKITLKDRCKRLEET